VSVSETLHGFPGGLTLPHHKQISLEVPLQRCPLPQRVYVPIAGHETRLLVSPGDEVLRGQVLTGTNNDFQVGAHAPCAGMIVDIADHPAIQPNGNPQRCIEIQCDPNGSIHPVQRLQDWQDTSPARLVDHLRQMGLAGMGGAMFPTPAKLRGPWPPIRTLILNGAECEPWIACDESLMRARGAEVVIGGLILAHAAGADAIVIAVEDPMAQTSEALKEAVHGLGVSDRISVVNVPSVYPQGGERQLIQCLTGLEVPHDGLPQDIGLLCHNVATAAAAFDAVELGKPVTERVVTVTGPGINRPGNFIVAIGTPAQWLIRQAGGYSESANRLIIGGPMSGIAVESDEFVITKGTNCLLALEVPPRDPEKVMPCINCGACVATCPASLMPQTLFRFIEAGHYEQSRKLGVFECIECGCCAQVCPSHLPLVDFYRHAKAQLRQLDMDHRRASLAKRRHEARQTRLSEEQAAREARRLARAEKLREKKVAKDEIEAAIARARQKKRSSRENPG
jgi:electron transport complex protein RnfC